MANRPTVSVVVVCMNRPDNLYPFLNGLREHCTAGYETFVVAYLFDKDKLTRVKEDFPWVTFIESDCVRGFSENNNLALAQAGGEYCFIVNDDTLMQEDVPGRLVQDIEALPEDAAIVSPRILNADGSLQLCGRPDYPPHKYFLQQWHLYSEPKDDTAGKTPAALVQGRRIFRTSNITGAAFLIRTEVFRRLGWFDERFFFTPEDIALSTLARERGFGVYVDADTAIIHKWKTTASSLAPAVRPAAVKGSLLFFGRRSAFSLFLLSFGVWLAENSKRFKAFVRMKLFPTEENRSRHRVFRNISRGIFSRKSPKELFVKYKAES